MCYVAVPQRINLIFHLSAGEYNLKNAPARSSHVPFGDKRTGSQLITFDRKGIILSAMPFLINGFEFPDCEEKLSGK